MRILMLSQFYPPFIGGEERSVEILATALAERGHEVAVATLAKEGAPAQEVDREVRVYRLRGTMQRATWLFADAAHTHAPPFPDPEIAQALRRIVARERPQVVHAHNWLVHSFLPLKPWSGARLVLGMHDYSRICATKKLLYMDRAPCSGPGVRKCMECSINHYGLLKGVPTVAGNATMALAERRLVDMFLPVSEAAAAGNGLPGSGLPYRVLPNFLVSEPGAGDEIRRWTDQLPRDGFILYVGAFASYKGIDVLLQAYRGLTDAPPLVLIGYTTAEYPVQTTDLPPNVYLLMNWPYPAVMEAWRRSSVGVAPSMVAETFGLVALEAMAMGTPVVASDIGALSEVVEHQTSGLIVPPGDVEALQSALALLLTDPALRVALANGALRRASLFTAESVVPRFEAVYAELVAMSNGASGLAAVRASE